MGKPGIALSGYFAIEQGMILAHQPDEVCGEQILHFHFRGDRPGVADAQVDASFTQRLIVDPRIADTKKAIEGLPEIGRAHGAAAPAE